jgi:hypothetical protein
VNAWFPIDIKSACFSLRKRLIGSAKALISLCKYACLTYVSKRIRKAKSVTFSFFLKAFSLANQVIC